MWEDSVDQNSARECIVSLGEHPSVLWAVQGECVTPACLVLCGLASCAMPGSLEPTLLSKSQSMPCVCLVATCLQFRSYMYKEIQHFRQYI